MATSPSSDSIARELRRRALDVDAALDGAVDRRGPRPRALLLHALLEARLVDAQARLGRHLARQVEREAVGVVQQERVLGADALAVLLARALDDLLEHLRALLERAVEALLLGAQPLLHEVALLRDARVEVAHQLGHDVGVRASIGKPGSMPSWRPRKIARRMMRRST